MSEISRRIRDAYIAALRSGVGLDTALGIALGEVDLMRFGYFRTDESSHNYLVPEEYVEEFDQAMETMDELAAINDMSQKFHAACNVFESEFSEFRIDGIRDYKVVMP